MEKRVELTTEQVAQLLGCSRQTIAYYVKIGRLKPYGKKGKSFVFDLMEIFPKLVTLAIERHKLWV